jgi:hypothetical protein
MKVYKYQNYEQYVKAQTEANVAKIKNIWVDKETIKKISFLQPDANFILCHGTRNAAEQKFFKEFYPTAKILGTEISHTAKKFPMTIQWDFHEINFEWLEKADIIYSNAFDHSYDPLKALNTWKSQLSENGKLYLEHGFSNADNRARKSDPLEIYESDLLDLFNETKLNLCDTLLSTGLKGKNPCKVYILKRQ